MNTAVNEYNYRFKLTDYAQFDRNRARNVAIYGRVSTEHEAQLSALENQLQWYDDQVKYYRRKKHHNAYAFQLSCNNKGIHNISCKTAYLSGNN